MRRARRGFTLWEISIVLALVALSAVLVIPAWTDLGDTPPPLPGDAVVALLRDARKVAIERSMTVAVRIDPASNYYRVDTTGVSGTGVLADGTLALGAYETLVTDLYRLQYIFRPTGAGLGDSVVVRGNELTVLLALDPWSGQTQMYAR